MSQDSRYFETMQEFSATHLFDKATGERKFDMAGGVAEAERLADLMRELTLKHSRSRKFYNAMTGWAEFVVRETKAAPENLDWAVLQGSIYAGYAI